VQVPVSKPKIEQVTIVCVTGVNILGALRSLLISSVRFNSEQVLFVNVWLPNFRIGKFRFERPINSKLDSIEEYGKYVQFTLWKHIETDFALIVQADGWVLNGKRWNEDFKNYDYVGAPWPVSTEAYIDPDGNHQRVGNGGFSLRSFKLLELGSQLELVWDVTKDDYFKHFNVKPLTEDGNICIHNRKKYESAGCIFAPLEVAARFSREHAIPEFVNPKTFGFHCYHPHAVARKIRPRLLYQSMKKRFTMCKSLLKRNVKGKINQEGAVSNRSQETSNFINKIANVIKAESYLEIGVETGKTLEGVEVLQKTGVDPKFLFNRDKNFKKNTKLFEMTSDDFFRQMASSNFLEITFDLIFIDGLHTLSQVKRDFLNSKRVISHNGVIIIDDTVPIDEFSALPSQEDCYRLRKASGKNDDGSWHGDVFKLICQLSLAKYEPLRMATISDLSNPKTVVWIESGDWSGLKIELNEFEASYEDLFRNGIPSCFNPMSTDEFIYYFSKKFRFTKGVLTPP
jgi:predicted O-methyltransferase YrrM